MWHTLYSLILLKLQLAHILSPIKLFCKVLELVSSLNFCSQCPLWSEIFLICAVCVCVVCVQGRGVFVCLCMCEHICVVGMHELAAYERLQKS